MSEYWDAIRQGKSVGLNILNNFDEIQKAKYLKRLGHPGHYTYIYNEPTKKYKVTIDTPSEVYKEQISTTEFYRDKDGIWDKNRVKNVHEPIIRSYLKDIKTSLNPTVTLMTSVDYNRIEEEKQRRSPLAFRKYSDLLSKSSLTTIITPPDENLSTEEKNFALTNDSCHKDTNKISNNQVFNKEFTKETINIFDYLEKSRSGVYSDTFENRKLGRVGQKYGNEKTENNDEYEQIRRRAQDIIEGRKRIIRLDERGEKGRLLGGKVAIEATCILGECRRATPTLYQESEQRDDPTVGNLERKSEPARVVIEKIQIRKIFTFL